MPHIRTTARNEIVTALQGMATPTAIGNERRLRIGSEMRPYVIVSLGESEIAGGDASMGDPYTVETQQQVSIELHAEADDGETLADQLDQLELEAEAQLEPISESSPFERLEPTSTGLETSVDSDRVVGVRTLQYLATWRHQFGAADTPEE